MSPRERPMIGSIQLNPYLRLTNAGDRAQGWHVEHREFQLPRAKCRRRESGHVVRERLGKARLIASYRGYGIHVAMTVFTRTLVERPDDEGYRYGRHYWKR